MPNKRMSAIIGIFKKSSLLLASGLGEDSRRAILSVSVFLGEHEVHYPKGMIRDGDHFYSFCSRSLQGVELIVNDDHPGLKVTAELSLAVCLGSGVCSIYSRMFWGYVP